MQDSARSYFNAYDDEVDEYHDYFGEQLNNLYSSEAPNIQKEAYGGPIEAKIQLAEMLLH